MSLRGKPDAWGRRVSLLFHLLKADKVIAEKNFGGDMVLSTLRVLDKRLPVRVEMTSRGKAVRAEPISALYADGLVHHVGVFDEMEIEMTTWTPESSESLNRMDALVWALTELMRAMVYDEVGTGHRGFFERGQPPTHVTRQVGCCWIRAIFIGLWKVETDGISRHEKVLEYCLWFNFAHAFAQVIGHSSLVIGEGRCST